MSRTSRLMPCPECDHDITNVVDTRPATEPFDHPRRRRVCASCGHRFTTREIIATADDLYGFMVSDD